MDCLRLLPVAGLMLWMLPLFWPQSADVERVNGSTAIIYVFAAWLFLIVAAGVLSNRLGAHIKRLSSGSPLSEPVEPTDQD